MEKTDVSTLTLIIGSVIFILFITVTFTYITTSYNMSSDNSNNISSRTVNENNNISNVRNNATNLPSNPKVEHVEIASYTTNIYDNDKNRIHNIKLASKTLDGTIVYKGTEFSFNNTLGNMGKEQGYKKAIGFDSKGNDIKVYGGGICQISSTLYNAVLIANLEVTERHAHSKRVYYVPKNKDATIFYGGPDFRFKNTLESDIIINVKADGNNVTVSLIEVKTMDI